MFGFHYGGEQRAEWADYTDRYTLNGNDFPLSGAAASELACDVVVM